MDKKSFILFFIFFTGFITFPCSAVFNVIFKNNIKTKLKNFTYITTSAGCCYGGYKMYTSYKERKKKLDVITTTSDQILEDAALFYSKSINVYKNFIVCLNENSELGIIKHILESGAEEVYPCIHEHNDIKEIFLPTLIQHKKLVQDLLEKNEIKEDLLDQTRILLDNLDGLISNLKKIDRIIITSNNFNEEKKYKHGLFLVCSAIVGHAIFYNL